MANAFTILTDDDPEPVLKIDGQSDWLLTVEHGGFAVPRSLAGLGLPHEALRRHIGWDPGALDLALALRERLDAHLVAQRYSRLVIDCNRPRSAHDLVPVVSDATPVPGNAGIDEAETEWRWNAIHAPFHKAVGDALSGEIANLLAIHSYDPQRDVDEVPRPWPIGLLWRQPNHMADRLARNLGRVAMAQPLGLNQPYQIEDSSDYTIPVHAEPRGLGHALVEVRNDHLQTSGDVNAIADLLFTACMATEAA